MRELMDEQVVQAAQEAYALWMQLQKDEYHTWVLLSVHDQEVWIATVRAAAPLLQFPWSEPTVDEVRVAVAEFFGANSYVDILVATDVCRQVIHRRNVNLMPKPVDTRKNVVLSVLRTNLGEFPEQLTERIIAALDAVKP